MEGKKGLWERKQWGSKSWGQKTLAEANPFLESLLFGSSIISAFGDLFLRQLGITDSFFVTQTFSFLSFVFLLFQHFLGDLRSHRGRTDPSNPAGDWTYVGRRELWQHYQKSTPPFVCDIFFLSVCVCVCVHASARVCVTMCAWLWEGVKLDSKILYNTAYICRGRELTHELNRDKEQIYLKWLCYIPWTTVQLFF